MTILNLKKYSVTLNGINIGSSSSEEERALKNLEKALQAKKNKELNKVMKHKHCKLIKAWADGAEIEVFNGEWISASDPRWTSPKYRIKPKKIKQTLFVGIAPFNPIASQWVNKGDKAFESCLVSDRTIWCEVPTMTREIEQ